VKSGALSPTLTFKNSPRIINLLILLLFSQAEINCYKLLYIYKNGDGLERNLSINGYHCSALFNQASGTPIVFLHGLSYTKEIWEGIGILGILKKKAIPFLALDMPYGMKNQCHPKTHNAEKNVTFTSSALQSIFGSQVPFLVGASIGGNIALRYAANFQVKGLLLIAPGRALEPDLSKNYSKFKFPTAIIWGSEDNIVPGENMRTLSDKLPHAKLIVYEGAAHSAYKDQPRRFESDLLEMYLKADLP
jgi:pimeloyl-ACP methyl ester carboxylesterase